MNATIDILKKYRNSKRLEEIAEGCEANRGYLVWWVNEYPLCPFTQYTNIRCKYKSEIGIHMMDTRTEDVYSAQLCNYWLLKNARMSGQ